MRPTLLASGLLLCLTLRAAAQVNAPHAYLPLDHWATPMIEHLIDRGALVDPSPMTRPWTVAQVAVMLEQADTTRLTRAERGTLQRLGDVLAPQTGSSSIMGEAEVAIRGSTHSRRPAFSLREEGPDQLTPFGGLNLATQFGPGLLVMRSQWNSNTYLNDPDFGGREMPVKVRFPEAYAGFRSTYFDVDVGAVSRNWGPAGMRGLLLSDWPLSYDHFFFRIGPRAIRLEMLIAQLERMATPSGDIAQRYFVAHRLTAQPWRWLHAAVWEGTLISARPGRTFELWYLNPIKIHFETEDERQSRTNVMIGGEGQVFIGRFRFGGAATVDDLQLFSTPFRNNEPPSYAVTLLAAGPAGPLRLLLGYTRVSNLMYRTPDPTESPLIGFNPDRDRIGTGLARNYSDYDETTLRLTYAPFTAVLAGAEFTLLRQGEGDFRLPFPAREDYDSTPHIFSGTVERTWRAAVVATAHLPFGLDLSANAGVHRVVNVDHTTGVGDTRFVATVTARYAFRRGWALRQAQ